MNNDLSKMQNGRASSFLKRLEQNTGRQSMIASRPKTAVVQFRCSMNSGLFHAVLIQHSPNHRFQIERIEIVGNSANGFTASAPSAPSAPSARSEKEAEPNSNDIAMGQLDFSGWYCPHCSFGKIANGDSFARCGKCQELVCGARIRLLDSGAKVFSCHDGCGQGGILSGHITSFKADTSDPAGLLGYHSQKAIGAASRKLLS